MGMINTTLILQVVNFLLAFFVLKKLFFVPVMTSIQEEQSAHNKLNNSIMNYFQRIKEQEQKKEEAWLACRYSLAKKKPYIYDEQLFVLRDIKSSLSAPLLDVVGEQRLEKEVEAAIVDKVSHVH